MNRRDFIKTSPAGAALAARPITGVHYPNDVAAGARLGQTIGAKVVTCMESQKDAEAVREEITSALAKEQLSCQTSEGSRPCG